MGITTKLDGYPAETLGGLTIGVSPLEMADAYATIASGGVYHKPIAITKIRRADGTVLKGKTLPKKLRPEAERRFQDGVTAEATKILEQNVQGGTGTKPQIGCPAAGKTGTTDEHSDAWFVGFTPRLVHRGLGRLSRRRRSTCTPSTTAARWPAARSRRRSGATT